MELNKLEVAAIFHLTFTNEICIKCPVSRAAAFADIRIDGCQQGLLYAFVNQIRRPIRSNFSSMKR
jgi:hypothetical protein